MPIHQRSIRTTSAWIRPVTGPVPNRALMAAVPGLRATIELLPTDVEAHFDDPKDEVK